MVEHSTADREVTGSIPVAPFRFLSLFFPAGVRNQRSGRQIDLVPCLLVDALCLAQKKENNMFFYHTEASLD